jgi:hypothetical protein
MTAVVCGEIVSSPHSYNYENLICIKFIIRELSSSLVIPSLRITSFPVFLNHLSRFSYLKILCILQRFRWRTPGNITSTMTTTKADEDIPTHDVSHVAIQ